MGQCVNGGCSYPISRKKWILSVPPNSAAPIECTGASPHRCRTRPVREGIKSEGGGPRSRTRRAIQVIEESGVGGIRAKSPGLRSQSCSRLVRGRQVCNVNTRAIKGGRDGGTHNDRGCRTSPSLSERNLIALFGETKFGCSATKSASRCGWEEREERRLERWAYRLRWTRVSRSCARTRMSRS
jgi:hypothetical protein